MSTLVMGILNVTPDSFADGGRHFSFDHALKRAEEMIAEGVDVIDVGGESTKPGAERVTETQELQRVIPVIAELVKTETAISIDTTRATIAEEAIKLGVEYVNDVSGGLADPNMYGVIAKNPDVQYIIMHWRSHSKTMQELAVYKDVVKEVKEELEERINLAIEEGVNPEQIIIDPGLGFSKLPEHNWELLRNIDPACVIGLPHFDWGLSQAISSELTGASNPDDREPHQSP